MNSSFLEEDVTLLLKDITGLVAPLPTEEREKRIQGGTHYSEMLPLEYRPTEDYIRIYEASLEIFGQNTADAIARVSDKIVREKEKKVVIVSLARAGTPLGILIRRYIRKKYGFECPHYSISIIRDRGIDRNAVNYIVERHGAECIQFVDGWTGKGAIYNELKKELKSFKGVKDSLAVLADPAGLTELCGTHDDIMIPSSCLNCTISGLITYFELLCNAHGLGTTIMSYSAEVLNELAPKAREMLNIPKEHCTGLIVGFGYPEIEYARGVQKDRSAKTHRYSERKGR